MKDQLNAPAPSIEKAQQDFAGCLIEDCLLNGAEGWREAMVAHNRLLEYVRLLEKRISELEKS